MKVCIADFQWAADKGYKVTSAKPTNSADDAVPAFNPVSFTRVFTKNSFRLLFIIIVYLSFVPSIPAEQRRVQLTEEEQKFLKSHPVIRVGTDESWAPFVSRNVNGELEGFDIDCLDYINETTGANIQLVTGQWADIVKKAKRHEIDGLATSAILDSRKPFFNFSDVYVSEYIIILTGSDSDLEIRGLEDLSGKTVVIHKGNEAYSSLLNSVPDINIIEADSDIAATKMMLEGKGDASLSGTSIYNVLHSNFLQSIQISYVVTEKPLDVVYSIRKDWPELLSIINKSLKSIPLQVRNKIYRRWFQVDFPNPEPLVPKVSLTEEEQDWVRKHPRFTVGSFPIAPYNIHESGTISGYTVDLLRAVSRQVGLEPEFRAETISSFPGSIRNGTIDIVTSLPYSQERDAYLEYSEASGPVTYAIYTHSSRADITDLDSLKGKTLAVTTGNIMNKLYAEYLPETTFVETQYLEEMFLLVSEGKADATIHERTSSDYMLRENLISNVRTVGPAHFGDHSNQRGYYYAASEKLPLLKSILDKSFRALPPGEKQRIWNHWFENEQHPAPTLLALTQEEKAWLQQHPVIRARAGDFPPYLIWDKGAKGISVELLNLIAERAGFQIDYVYGVMSWPEALENIRNHEKVDLLPTAKHTKEREDFLVFSRDYLKLPWVIFTRKDENNIFSLEDLSGKTIAIEEGFVLQGKLAKEYPEIKQYLVKNTALAMAAVSENRADAYVGTLTVAQYIITHQGFTNLKVAAPADLGYHTQAFAMRDDWPELASILDKGLAAITPEERSAIHRKYFTLKVAEEVDYALIRWILLTISIVICFILFWNRLLHRQVVQRTDDLRQHKEHLEELVEKRTEQLRKLYRAVEQSHSTIVITDLDANIEFVNPAFTRTTGYTREEAIGQNPRILKSGVQDASLYRIMWDTLSRGEVWQGEMHNKRKDGSFYWEFASISPVKNEAGQTTHYVAVKEEITARKEMENELIQARQQAEDANKAKSKFLANMSHELRTPLNAILGYTQFFSSDSSLTPKQQDGIQTMHHSSEHLLMLINDILDLSKIESGKMELVTTGFCLPDFLQEVVNIIKVRTNEKGLAFHYEPEGPLPSFIEADEVRLRQVLLNLLSNAVKFTSQGHCTLRVQSRPVNKNRVLLTFTIEDSGVGITSEMQEKVFDPFKQVGDRLQYAEGTGLGLPISLTLIHLMHGTLQLISPINEQPTTDEGPGCCFSFAIEVRTVSDVIVVDQEKRKVTGYIIPGGQNVQKKILVVDDNISNRAVLRDILEPLGFNIKEAADGSEVLAVCQGFQPDAILMDLRMPKMDGFSATRRVKGHEDFVDIPIIAITASSGDKQNLKQRCVESGFSGFLTKPFIVTDLLDTLADQLHIELRYSEGTKEPLNELEIVPPRRDILDNLVKLARSGDINAVSEQAAKLAMSESGKYKVFAHRIEQLAENFQLIEIVKLISMYEKE